jgi:hypothetical protein
MFGNGIHLGVENEIANVDDDIRKKLAVLPRAWMFMKSDSSVECGVECVFHPTTLAYFQQNKDIIDKHFDCGIKPHSSAGMHIHMGKANFGTYQLFKFIQFFKDHADFIDKIAGREGCRYARRLDDKAAEIAKTAKYSEDGAERYRAININNKATIEVRIFAGVTKTKDFMKNIEFCDALYNFTKISPHFKKGKIPLSYFVAYVEQYRHQYPNLNVFLGGTAPKEIPKKYRKGGQVEPPSQSMLVDHVPVLEQGARVILTSMDATWDNDNYNPLHGTNRACEGVLTNYSESWMCCRVQWDNGCSNSYNYTNLTAI